MGRFGLAYKAELAYYLDQCVAGAPFAVDHGAGRAALEVAVAVAGSGALRKKSEEIKVEFTRM